MTNPPDHVVRWRGVDIARWSLCAVTILTLHASAAALLILMSERGAPAAGSPSAIILEDMLPEVASLPSEVAEQPPGPEMQKTEDLPERPAEKPDDEDATTEAVKPVEPEPEAPPAPLAPKPEVAVAPPREPEPPKPIVKPVEKRPELPKRPVPKKKPVQKPVRQTTAPQQAPQTDRPRTVQGETSSQSASIAKADWNARVVSILRSNLRFPAGAQRRGVRGLASVRLTVGRGGQLISASLSGSAGDSELDQEAVSLVRRVSYPPLPEAIRGGSYTVTAPIRFK